MLKVKLDQWRAPLSYKSASRNLLQRHFKKVTNGSWFAEGAVFLPLCTAASIERRWGVCAKGRHPLWDDVLWQNDDAVP
ncbi:MAG: hypothetical protein EBR09_07650 [Proteobacteria bacterium]|nr:hypothetical protein [Pseudomonadota bacterium]